MKNLFWAFCLIYALGVQADPIYHYSFNLDQITGDQLQVTLEPPTLTEDEVIFSLPKMVPGTYAVYDFGRFIHEVQAFDKHGAPLPVQRIDTNSWKISKAYSLGRLIYKADDTYDGFPQNPVFEPAGTDFQKDTAVVLNWHTMLGYFRNHTRQPYEITVDHSARFFGSTSLRDMDASAQRDRFLAESYNDLIDNPVMFAATDTAHVRVGNTDVLIGLYTPTGKATARGIAAALDTLLQAAGKYLGGQLPVDRYSFLIYLTTHPGMGGGVGALEHSYCSMYYLMDGTDQSLAPMLRDVAAHEFFHIITPLNIHSYEIENFDFDHPQMSEHLWLYEGSTEYHAHSVQVKYGFVTQDEFLKGIKQKMDEAQFSYNDTLPFTHMSKHVLDSFEKEYQNVYAKGALISMCLDLELLHHSNGKSGLVQLIMALSKEYGKKNAFHDDELFAKIVSLTYPELKDFFVRYVMGPERLPFERVLGYAGVKYERVAMRRDFSLGQFGLGYNPATQRFIISDISNMNEFGKKLGVQKGDEVLKINGKKINPMAFQEWRAQWLATVKEGDMVTMLVNRMNDKGKVKKVKLSAAAFKAEVKKYNVLTLDPNATPEQLAVRKAWLER